ncbi:hypothetical protein GWI33_009462, partial [Rhynchophorus ferrugineus]
HAIDDIESNCDQENEADALPNLDWSNLEPFIPDDICRSFTELPRQSLPIYTAEGDEMDIAVVEIYDPSKFWVSLGTSNNSELNNLTNNMKNFYRRKEIQKEYSVPISVIQESLNCVTLICGEYHRARILEVILNSNEPRVFCIDYGKVFQVHFNGIYFLKTDFAELPAQAIRCQLHNIAPKLRNRIWPRSACTAFKEMVNRKNIKMKIVYVNWDEECS